MPSTYRQKMFTRIATTFAVIASVVSPAIVLTQPASAAVDPISLLKTISVGQYPTDVVSDGTYVYSINSGYAANSVTILDAKTGAFVKTVSLGSGANPTSACLSGGNVFVTKYGTGSITKLGGASYGANVGYVINANIWTSIYPIEVTCDSNYVWVVNPDSVDSRPGLANSISQINASTGAVVRQIPVTDPKHAYSDGTYVWVNSAQRYLVKINASTGAVVSTTTIGLDTDTASDYFNYLASDGTNLWLSNCWNNQITELKASDLSLVRTIPVNDCTGTLRSDGTYLWTTTAHSDGNGSYNGTVYQISLATGQIVNTLAVGTIPQGSYSDGHYLWVADNPLSKVYMIGVPRPATNTVAPAMTDSTSAGRFAVNDNVTTTDGTWNDSTGSYTYSWYRCTSNTATDVTTSSDCSAISSATSATYKLTSSDSGKYIVAVVTATGTDSTTTSAQSNFSSKLVLGPAVNTALPVVTDTTSSGRFTQGDTVSTTTGTWTNASGTYTYKWYRCSTSSVSNAASDANCSAIASATASTYVLTSSDLNKWIASVVTATGTDASTTVKASALTIKITNPAINTVAPVLSDTTSANRYKVGDTVSTTSGTWTNQTGSYAYKWYRCTTTGVTAPDTDSNCAVISGATSSTYTLTSSDMGKYMIALVTATGNDSTTTSKASNMSSKAVVNPAANSVAPVLSDTTAAYQFHVGDTVSTTNGTWTSATGPYTYSWYACTGTSNDATSDSNCTAISSATSSTFVLTSSQLGKYIYAVVTATGLDGTTTYKMSNISSAVSDPATNTVAPVMSDTTSSDRFAVGDSLSVTSGTWTNRTGSYSYSWYRCSSPYYSDPTAGYPCTLISSATSSSYTITTSDYDTYLVAVVTTSGPDGKAVNAQSNGSSIAVPGPAVNTYAPALASSGGSTYTSGSMVSVSQGSWTRQSQTVPLSYAWYRCTATTATNPSTDSTCSVISGATSSLYNMTSNDVDKYLVVVVTATGTDGTTTKAMSNFSSKVVAGSSGGGGGGSGGGTVCATPGTMTVCDITLAWRSWSTMRISWSAPSGFPPGMVVGYKFRNQMNQVICESTSAAQQYCDFTWSSLASSISVVNASVTPTLNYGPSTGDGPSVGLTFPVSFFTIQAFRTSQGIMAIVPFNGSSNGVGISSTSTTVTVGGKTCTIRQGVNITTPFSGDCGTNVADVGPFGFSFINSMGLSPNTSYNVTGELAYTYSYYAISMSGQTLVSVNLVRPFSFTWKTLASERQGPASISAVSNSNGTYTVTWSDVSGAAAYDVFGSANGVTGGYCTGAPVQTGSTWSCVVDGGGSALDTFYVQVLWDDVADASNTVPTLNNSSYGFAGGPNADGFVFFGSVGWNSSNGSSGSGGNGGGGGSGGSGGGGTTAPGAPTGVTASSGNGQATVTWTAPSNTGGASITGYTVQYSSDGGLTWTTASCTGTATSCTVTGLTNGTNYIFQVAATNSSGTGSYSSSSSSVSPSAPSKPGSPTLGQVTSTDTSVTVNWTAPSNTGGAAITGYTVTITDGAGNVVGTCTSTGTSCTVSPLTAGTNYTVSVVATNAIGSSTAVTKSTATTNTAGKKLKRFYIRRYHKGQLAVKGKQFKLIKKAVTALVKSGATTIRVTGWTNKGAKKIKSQKRAMNVTKIVNKQLVKLHATNVQVTTVGAGGTKKFGGTVLNRVVVVSGK